MIKVQKIHEDESNLMTREISIDDLDICKCMASNSFRFRSAKNHSTINFS